MKITKLSMITSAVIAATLSASAVAGHHEEKISMGFNAMDKDGNGYIVGSESSGVIDSKLLAKMDTDGDSMISRVEFNKFVDEKRCSMAEIKNQRVTKFFRALIEYLVAFKTGKK